jgi:hypothetical protein
MSDFTDSLKDDDEFKTTVLEMFDRAKNLHSCAETEFEQAYHQGEKDAIRRILAILTGMNVDLLGNSSVVAYKLRGDIPLDNGTFIKH